MLGARGPGMLGMGQGSEWEWKDLPREGEGLLISTEGSRKCSEM